MSNQDDRVRQAMLAIDADRPARPDTGMPAVRIGLLGRGIGASLTPIMHESEGRRLGLSYRYDLIDFDRLGLEDSDLGAVLEQAPHYQGFNVTYPFKQAVITLLDELSPEAAAIGAVNTIVNRDGRRVGHNTDCWGFAQSVRKGLGDVAVDTVLQIGAGGAGAAVAHALVQLGARHIDIVDADLAKAQALAERVRTTTGIATRALPPDQVPTVIRGASGVVNATPVGMDKHPGLPFPSALLHPDQWVADIIYFPRETQLLRQARDLGCRVLPGGGMAINQAVRAFNLFTGLPPDAEEMGRTFLAYA